MVSGLVLTSSDCTIRFGLGVGLPLGLMVNGLGNTAPRIMRVAGELPSTVWGLQPVGLCSMPREMVPPRTPMYVTDFVVVPGLLHPAASKVKPSPPRSNRRRHLGPGPRCVTAVEGPASALRRQR